MVQILLHANKFKLILFVTIDCNILILVVEAVLQLLTTPQLYEPKRCLNVVLELPILMIYSFPSIVLFVICISPSHGLYITPKSCPAGIEFVWIQTDLLFSKRDFEKLAFQAIEAI